MGNGWMHRYLSERPIWSVAWCNEYGWVVCSGGIKKRWFVGWIYSPEQYKGVARREPSESGVWVGSSGKVLCRHRSSPNAGRWSCNGYDKLVQPPEGQQRSCDSFKVHYGFIASPLLVWRSRCQACRNETFLPCFEKINSVIFNFHNANGYIKLLGISQILTKLKHLH